MCACVRARVEGIYVLEGGIFVYGELGGDGLLSMEGFRKSGEGYVRDGRGQRLSLEGRKDLY